MCQYLAPSSRPSSNLCNREGGVCIKRKPPTWSGFHRGGTYKEKRCAKPAPNRVRTLTILTAVNQTFSGGPSSARRFIVSNGCIIIVNLLLINEGYSRGSCGAPRYVRSG